jgi:hypothetical protein
VSKISLDIGAEHLKLIIEREARPPSRTTQRTRRMRKAVKVELPLGRTTLTAANGEYDEESGRAVVTSPPRHSVNRVPPFPL